VNDSNFVSPSIALQPQRPDVSGASLQVTSCAEAAVNYLNKKYSVIPIDGRNKKPLVAWQEFQKRLPTLEEVENLERFKSLMAFKSCKYKRAPLSISEGASQMIGP